MNPYLWRCPLCHEPLSLTGRSFTCSNGHSFDQAKEGYVNLLRLNRKHSADPGDNKAMLDSRRHFLQQDFYAPLAAGLAQTIRQTFPDPSQPLTVLDADGNAFPTDKTKPATALCRCGASGKKPFCDGTHKTIGFQAAERAPSAG